MHNMPTPEDERARLSALRALRVLDTPPEAELDTITLLAADCFEAPIALISLVDEDCQWFISRVGLLAHQTERSVSFCSHAILSNDVFVVTDASVDDRFRENPMVTGSPGIRFYAGAPLVLSGGERVGTLCVIDDKPRCEFSEREARALKMMAHQAVNHLETRRLRAAQQILQLIADTTTDAFICIGVDGRITYWNRGAEVTFGFSESEAIGNSLDIIIAPEHLVSRRIDYDSLIEGEG